MLAYKLTKERVRLISSLRNQAFCSQFLKKYIFWLIVVHGHHKYFNWLEREMLVDLSNIQTLANYMQARQRWTLGCSQSVRMYTCMCICMPSKNSFFKCMSVHLNAIYLSGSHLITYQFLARKFERFKRTLKFSKHATYVQRWTGEAIVSCPETHIPDERKKNHISSWEKKKTE